MVLVVLVGMFLVVVLVMLAMVVARR